jgi:phosphoenolpyruvate-protein kinase (PTS system EI component)
LSLFLFRLPDNNSHSNIMAPQQKVTNVWHSNKQHWAMREWIEYTTDGTVNKTSTTKQPSHSNRSNTHRQTERERDRQRGNQDGLLEALCPAVHWQALWRVQVE